MTNFSGRTARHGEEPSARLRGSFSLPLLRGLIQLSNKLILKGRRYRSLALKGLRTGRDRGGHERRVGGGRVDAGRAGGGPGVVGRRRVHVIHVVGAHVVLHAGVRCHLAIARVAMARRAVAHLVRVPVAGQEEKHTGKRLGPFFHPQKRPFKVSIWGKHVWVRTPAQAGCGALSRSVGCTHLPYCSWSDEEGVCWSKTDESGAVSDCARCCARW